MKDFKLTSLLNAELEDSALNKVRGGNDSGCAAPKGSCKSGDEKSMGTNTMSALNKIYKPVKPYDFKPSAPDTLRTDTVPCTNKRVESKP